MKKNIQFKGLIFDMDGTITVPSIDFNKIREELGIPSGDIVEIIALWPKKKAEEAWALIEKYEEEVLSLTKFQDGARESLLKFKNHGIRLGLLTRNSRKSADAVLLRLKVDFDIVLTREFPFVKPRPEPVIHILESWALHPEETLVVGDYIHDIESGKNAGACSCFFENPGARSYSEHADYSIKSFRELESIVLR